jgi:hypothetical protein
MMTQRAPLSAALVRATCASDSEQAGGPANEQFQFFLFKLNFKANMI